MRHIINILLALLWPVSGTASDMEDVAYCQNTKILEINQIIEDCTFSRLEAQNSFPVKAGNGLYFKITTLNPTNKPDTIFFRSNIFDNKSPLFTYYLFDASGKSVGKGGCWVKLKECMVPQNRFGLKIPIPPNTLQTNYLQIQIHKNGVLNNLAFEITTQEQLINEKLIFRGKFLWNRFFLEGIFWGVLLLMMALAYFQYVAYQEGVYKYYLFYLIALSLQYFRAIGGRFHRFLSSEGDIGALSYAIEPVAQSLTFAMYTLFIYYTLDIQNQHRKIINYIFKFCLYSIMSLGITSFFFALAGDNYSGHRFENIFRIPFSLVAVIIIFYLLFYNRTRGSRLILLGTILLFLPATFTALAEYFNGRIGYYANSTFNRSFHFTNSSFFIPMYSTKIGVVLEVIFFNLALSARTRDRIMIISKKDQPKKNTGITTSSPKYSEQLKRIVLQNMDKAPYDVADICKTMGVSRSKLHVEIKDETGLSVTKFINQIKMEVGKNLLLETDQNISSIAYQLGFSDPNYFTRVFTRTYGISPRRFRKNS